MMHPRLYRLVEAHQRIDDALRREQKRRWPDGLQILRLKKLKLKAKDLIDRFTRTAVRT
jgi:hypothetical protein